MYQKKEEESKFFDNFLLEKKAEYDVLSERAYQKIISTFNKTVKYKAGDTLIDLGCGTGAFTRRLNQDGLKVLGMDISPLSIERAKAISDGETYLTGDILKTGFETNHFDIIVYSGVLHHFPEFAPVLKEGFRILKNGGQVFTLDPNLGNLHMWLYRSPNSPFYSTKGMTPNEKFFNAVHLKGKLAACGFESINVFAISGITYRFVESNFIKRILPLYNFGEIIFGKTPLEKRFGSFLIGYAVKGKDQ